MRRLPEDATEVFLIERKNQYAQSQVDDSVPQQIIDEFKNEKKEGATATRNKGFKHLT